MNRSKIILALTVLILATSHSLPAKAAGDYTVLENRFVDGHQLLVLRANESWTMYQTPFGLQLQVMNEIVRRKLQPGAVLVIHDEDQVGTCRYEGDDRFYCRSH